MKIKLIPDRKIAMEITWVKGSNSWFWIHANGKNIHIDPAHRRGSIEGPEMAEKACKRICGLFNAVPLRCCRADLVIRRAFITPELMGLGVTAYMTACGESSAEAKRTLEAALAAFTDAL